MFTEKKHAVGGRYNEDGIKEVVFSVTEGLLFMECGIKRKEIINKSNFKN